MRGKKIDKKKISFWWVYLGFVIVLVCLVGAAVFYVNDLLHRYEETQPKYYVERTMESMVADAANGTFLSKYLLPEISVGKFEVDRDIKAEYISFYTNGELTYTQKSGAHAEDELYYIVKNGDVELAEIKLKALGPAETKLTVLNYREWKVESVKPLLAKKDYTLSVPAAFSVRVNGVSLTEADGVTSDGNETVYTVSGVYLEPEFEIIDWEGGKVEYAIDDCKVLAEFYSYDLTLPSALIVQVNGELCEGEALDKNRKSYHVLELDKPTVIIADHFGNAISYEGQTNVALTYTVITADSRQRVLVNGAEVPAECITIYDNPEFEQLKGYATGLPQICEYSIAVLSDDVEITVADANGNVIPFEKGQTAYDFKGQVGGLEAVPEAIAKETDVLKVAQAWSLFMSADAPFSEVAQYMIKDSYQYKVAYKYANGIDITFTSGHVLLDPTFTENTVSNFMWISEDCFSVDISFVKHMRLKNGKYVDDYMNDRFYFVLYDGTNDKKDNPTWKMASMKEIVDNAE